MSIQTSLEWTEMAWSPRAAGKTVLDRLMEYMNAEEAARVLKFAIEWGRYAELYEYAFSTRCQPPVRENAQQH
ncbi:AAA-associated domain-containing protein [Pseudomonas sp. PI1]|uniref:AAA-associated domain-containing protein n=1 Tax=Pseudomonas sp. PI1 TaxID=1582493 RepID=UPI0005BA0AB3|nr:AAA-associated domain-containing protein [Pseudomonas sp. PI1]KWR85197.1 hypothetical protein RN02_02740 [Pseudomonas sp. PI1]